MKFWPLQARSDGAIRLCSAGAVLPAQSIRLIGVNLFGAHLERIAVRQFALDEPPVEIF